MKKLFILVSVVMAITVAVILAGPENVTVGTNSVILLPRRGEYQYSSIATGVTYVVGQYVEYNGRDYLITSGGSWTNTAPTHISGSASYDGVTLRYVNPGDRKYAIITTDCSTNIYCSIGDKDAEVNKGIRLNADGSSLVIGVEDKINDEVRGIAATAGNNVTVTDR